MNDTCILLQIEVTGTIMSDNDFVEIATIMTMKIIGSTMCCYLIITCEIYLNKILMFRKSNIDNYSQRNILN